LVDDDTLANTPDQTFKEKNGIQSLVLDQSEAMFTNYDEKEESTCIKQLIYLKFRPLMLYAVLPILSLLTLFILPLIIYWKKNWQLELFYKKASKDEATHMLVIGQTTEIKKIHSYGFEYRFIKYEFIQNKFVPVLFDAV